MLKMTFVLMNVKLVRENTKLIKHASVVKLKTSFGIIFSVWLIVVNSLMTVIFAKKPVKVIFLSCKMDKRYA